MKTKLGWWMASLVAMVAVLSFMRSNAADEKSKQGILRTNSIVISIDGGQPEGGGGTTGTAGLPTGSMVTRAVQEGVESSMLLVSNTTVTVTLRGYETSVTGHENGTDFILEVPEGTSNLFASGTNAETGAYFTGGTNVTLTANTVKTIHFKIQNISAWTQFTILAYSGTATDAGGAYSFVAKPAP